MLQWVIQEGETRAPIPADVGESFLKEQSILVIKHSSCPISLYMYTNIEYSYGEFLMVLYHRLLCNLLFKKKHNKYHRCPSIYVYFTF